MEEVGSPHAEDGSHTWTEAIKGSCRVANDSRACTLMPCPVYVPSPSSQSGHKTRGADNGGADKLKQITSVVIAPSPATSSVNHAAN